MAGILPIPIGRTSDMLVSTRLRQQLQFDQLSLLDIQSQVSTGRRVLIPSQDAPASVRAMTLQRLLEQKSQVRTNLETSRSYLSATENSLSSVSQLLADVRGQAVAAADSTRSEEERKAAAQTVSAAIDQLLDIANHKFRDRFLFAGSDTTQRPYQQHSGFISYAGDEGHLLSYSDTDVLFATNRTGNEALGALSAEVRGMADLNPVLSADTKLSNLRGGAGIKVGSFVISDGLASSTIDITGVETVGDLVRRMEANPPAGNKVIARITPTGLEISLANPGSLAIREVGSGTTASELGIAAPGGVGNASIVGDDLNPRITATTSLDDLIGVRARALIESPGTNNNIQLMALERGDALNGYRVQFVDDSALQAAPGLTAGAETVHLGSETSLHARASLALIGADNDLLLTAVSPGSGLNHVSIRLEAVAGLGDASTTSFDSGSNTLTLRIDDSGATQLGTLVDAIESTGLFTVAPDASAGEAYDPASSVLAANAGVVSGNTSGSGGDEKTIFVHIAPGGSSARQVIDALNADPTVSSLFSASFDAKETLTNSPAGSGAVAVTATAATTLGAGEEFDAESGIRITQGDETFVIDVSSAKTVEDLLNLFNGSPAHVLAQLKADGTGIDVRSRLSGVDFQIGENGGRTATQLGIRSFNEATELSELNHGRGLDTIEGSEFTIRRNDGVELEIDLSGAVTVADLLARINEHPDNLNPASAVVARLSAVGNSIELVDDSPAGGATLTVVRNQASEAAWNLGLIPSGENEAVASQAVPAVASFSGGVPNSALTLTADQAGAVGNDIEIVLEDALTGDAANVSFDSVSRRLTIQIDASQTTANTVAAAINDHGMFTAVWDTTAEPTNDGSGLMAGGLTLPAVVAATGGGAPDSLIAAEVNPLETKSAFNTLLRLRSALLSSDIQEIQRAVANLDGDLDRVNFIRGDLGAREQSLDVLASRLDSEEIELKGTLSAEIEVDLVEAISELTLRQASAEASMRVMAQLSQLSLLNFL